nr:HAMP domain-containing histidine kinase [Candidatus Saccharibacteria bacterium]
MRQKYRKIVAVAIVALVSFVFHSQSSFAASFLVTNTNDSGVGSLRQAVIDANADGGAPHIIEFNISGSNQHIIELQSHLPSLSRQTLVDGFSQPGSSLYCQGGSSAPKIAIAPASGDYATLSLASSSEVRGLAFGAGASVYGYGGTTVHCNYFGTLDGINIVSNWGSSQFSWVSTGYPSGGAVTITDNVFAGMESTNSTSMIEVGATIDATGNFFGTDSTRTHNLKHEGSVHTGISSTNSGYQDVGKIGGVGPSDRNYFYHLDYAISFFGATVLGNIYEDNGLNIGDYSNIPLEAPLIRSTAQVSGDTQVNVELGASLAAGNYRLEFYSNPSRHNDRLLVLDGVEVQHGMDGTELVGTVTVTKSSSNAETVAVTVPGTSYTHLTVTATADLGSGTYGSTTPMGNLVPEDVNLGVTLDTGIDSDRCYVSGSTGEWTIQVNNNGTEALHEMILSYEALSSGLSNLTDVYDLNALTIGGTADSTSHISHNIPGSNSMGAVFFWEGTLEPGQNLRISIPATYTLPGQALAGIVRVQHLPPDVLNSDRIAEYLEYRAVNQYDTQTSLDCQYVGDLATTVTVPSPGIIAGGTGVYSVRTTNYGPVVYPDGNPTSLNDFGEFRYMQMIAIPKNTTVQSVSLNGQPGCLVVASDISGYNPQACAVVCIDYSTVEVDFDQFVASTPYSNIFNCVSAIGLGVGAHNDLDITVQVASNIDQQATFGAVSFPISAIANSPNSLTDPDMVQFMLQIQVEAWITGAASPDLQEMLLLEMYTWPINNAAQYIGLNLGTEGLNQPTDGPSSQSNTEIPSSKPKNSPWFTPNTDPTSSIESVLPLTNQTVQLFGSYRNNVKISNTGCATVVPGSNNLTHAFTKFACAVGISTSQLAAGFPWIIIILLAILTIQAIVRAYHSYVAASQSRVLLARKKLLAEEKKSFLALASHYLRTPLTIISGGISLLPKESTAQVQFTTALHPLEQTAKKLITGIEENSMVTQIKQPSELEYKETSLLRSGFLIPAVSAVVLLLLINLILATVIRVDISLVQVLTQLLIALIVSVALYTSIYLTARYKNDQRRDEQLTDYHVSLDSARARYIAEAHNSITPDLEALKNLPTDNLPADSSKFILEGTKELDNLLQKFTLVAMLQAGDTSLGLNVSVKVSSVIDQTVSEVGVTNFRNQVPSDLDIPASEFLMHTVFQALITNANEHNAQ